MTETEIVIPEISFNTQDSSPTSLPTRAMTYLETCFRQTAGPLVSTHEPDGLFPDNINTGNVKQDKQ
jgi:hypothetical protein